MKNYLTLTFTLICYVSSLAQTPVWSEDFDGANTSNPLVFSEQCADDKDYFDIVCPNGAGCTNEISSDFTFFNTSGQHFGIRDADADPCSSTFPKSLSFNGIDISSCAGVTNVTYICFDLAESRNMGDDMGAEWSTSNMREDTWDGNSNVSFTAAIDGGNAQQITALEAFDNSDTRAGIDVNCDGKSDDAGEPELTDTFTKYCFELPLQGASMDLVITVDGLNTQGEDLAIDNIEIYCESSSTNLPGTLLDACTPFVYVEPGPANAIWSENFDGSNTTNPPVFSEQCADDKDYFDIVCPNGAGCANEINSDFTFFNTSGQHFGIRDADADPCSGTFPKTLSFNGIDISSCSGGSEVTYICFDLAESRNMGDDAGAEWSTSNMREDTWDSNSSVTFTADIDGTGPQQITALEAFENSDTRPGLDVNCDGRADDPGEPELTDTFTKYCFELPSQGASLDLVINVDGLNTQGEDLAIDNIEIYCESNPANLPQEGTLLDACTPFTAMPLTVVWSEDFDGSNTGPTFAFPAGCDPTPSRDYLGIICLDGMDCPNEMNADYVYFGAQGQFMGVRDMDASCGTLDETVEALGIDISSCAGSDNLYLCFDMAESKAADALNDRETNSSDGTEDTWDGSSSVSFSITIDGVTTQVIALESSDGTNTAPAIDNDCGGGSADGSIITGTFTTYCFQLPSLGNSADLSIQFLELNTDGEDLAIDNFVIYCVESADPLPVPLTEPCFSLPIELTSFEAIANGNMVDLKWVTATELNNDYFSIERSFDAVNFEEIAKADGAGDSYETLTYIAVDRQPNIGLNYYRLKQVDFDEQYSYSEIRSVIIGRKYPINISPNPVRDMLTVQSDSGQISVFNAFGQLISTQILVEEGSLELDMSDLVSGTYFIVHTDESGEESSLRFVKID